MESNLTSKNLVYDARMITPPGPQLPTDLPSDYLDVMLPELVAKWQLGHDTHQQVLNVLENQGFHSAVKTLMLLMTLSKLGGDV